MKPCGYDTSNVMMVGQEAPYGMFESLPRLPQSPIYMLLARNRTFSRVTAGIGDICSLHSKGAYLELSLAWQSCLIRQLHYALKS